MNDKIPFLKNNSEKGREDWQTSDWLEEFKKFLMGSELPNEITIGHGNQPKLSSKKAITVIWYLQEHLSVFPDTIEECYICKDLFDSASEGIYWETKGRHYCGGCCDQVPYNYDRGKR